MCAYPLFSKHALRRVRYRALPLCIGIAVLGGCTTPPANERETGSGGTLVRYSSRQVSVDLTDAQRQALTQLRDHVYHGPPQGSVVDAVASTLSAQGYTSLSVDHDTGIVEAERNLVLIPKWREIVRGVLKSRVGALPAKPDHERMAVIAAVRAAEGTNGTLVRVRFERTVWDSNGDSRTETVVQRDLYEGFFEGVDQSLRGKSSPTVTLSCPKPACIP
jgi:hypothetical protein